MENVAIGLAYRPEAILAVIAPSIFPDQNRLLENSRPIIETDTAFAQRPGVLCLVPLEFQRSLYAYSVPLAIAGRWMGDGIGEGSCLMRIRRRFVQDDRPPKRRAPSFAPLEPGACSAIYG